jgi:hypothetical protein
MFRWKEAAKLETEATWLEGYAASTRLEQLTAALTLKQIKGHCGAFSGCAERF